MATATPNYSLFAIPAYLVIAMVPHAYSVSLITKYNKKLYDMPSPRSSGGRTEIEKSVPRAIYREYERCRAAHSNMFENMGFVVGGILSGVVGKVDAGYMNRIAAVYLASRVLYTISYVKISSPKLAPLRTLWYMYAHPLYQKSRILMNSRVGMLAITTLYWKTGIVLVRNGTLP